MSENNLKILEAYIEIDKIHDEIVSQMFNFINKASELVTLSEDVYQIEKNLELNKISLKGFILESSCCTLLNQNNVRNYSIQELKNYLKQYEAQSNEDCYKYYLAISLYELIEKIKKLVDSKISLEITEISKMIPEISNVKNIESSKLEELYLNLKTQLNNLGLSEKNYDICIQLINDIFNYYISGYPDIPEDYLYNYNE